MKHSLILVALAASACAPAGYMSDAGNFKQTHRTPAVLCAPGQPLVLDPNASDCVMPPPPSPPPTPTPMQLAQSEAIIAKRLKSDPIIAQQLQSERIMSERNACVSAATRKFQLQAEGVVGSSAIWHAEMKQCDDLWISRATAEQVKSMGGNCSLKLDWMLRYRMMVYDPDQKAMAEDRFREFCGRTRPVRLSP